MGNKKLIVKKFIIDLCRDKLPDKEPNNRQPPKHPIKDYAILIILKESKTASLRDAETKLSEYVCGRRIDYATIHYWEKHLPRRCLRSM